MKQTVVAVFESSLKADDAVHVLRGARFVAERLPRIARQDDQVRQAATSAVWRAMTRRFREFMDADMYLQPYATALAQGRFVVKVYVDDLAEATAAQRILETFGGTQIDFLADEWA